MGSSSLGTLLGAEADAHDAADDAADNAAADADEDDDQDNDASGNAGGGLFSGDIDALAIITSVAEALFGSGSASGSVTPRAFFVIVTHLSSAFFKNRL